MNKRPLYLLLAILAALFNIVLFFCIVTSFFLFPCYPPSWLVYVAGAFAVLLSAWLEAGAARRCAVKWAGDRSGYDVALEKADVIVKIIFSVFYLACYVVSDATGMNVNLEIYAIVVLFLILFLSPTLAAAPEKGQREGR
jgi:hypothetical protein